MARGKQKEQARERAQKLADKQKGGKSQLGARAAGLKVVSKHPKDPIPPESAFIA
ncbi:hypothetical protein SYNPS1DRAFT_15313 [Syncephalis pseudoplumigaleata]|uniref:Small EDRK-rich factor-like N-terminal domain-containing protein n=1 Tax=Syncephalis pseudoplumigaleata TaxID=1712513 RepID=A0A4P9YZT3_9FUNG|nr:hypothetical protein SYNPS1DRAFT_15313 [Syncephalis pseudoplumigaleata]|eukprot:RKP25687.1 hypothetical protein SYNPS1DRAFT_15313 [Syncephalis pseudoplumigaleata]